MRISSRSIRAILVAGAICLTMATASCTGKKASEEAKGETGQPAAQAQAQNFMVMEKILSDQPNRPRTTMKIIVPGDSKSYTDVLKAALDETRKQDKSLKAVIIWAYRNRGELNGSNFTVGKVEWAEDGKDFNGEKTLSPNPKIDLMPATGK